MKPEGSSTSYAAFRSERISQLIVRWPVRLASNQNFAAPPLELHPVGELSDGTLPEQATPAYGAVPFLDCTDQAVHIVASDTPMKENVEVQVR